MHPSSFHAQRERGVALVVSMVMLVAITIIGVFVMNSSHLEWLMSNNSRFQTDAEMRAEAALRDGEKTIENPPSPWDSTNGLYNSATLTGTMDPRKVSSWANLNTLNATTLAPAQYVVESLGASCLGSSSSSNPLGPISCGSQPGWTYLKIDTYRVWALATDGKGAARITQSIYWKIDNPHAALTIGSIPIPQNNPISQPSYRRIHYADINND